MLKDTPSGFTQMCVFVLSHVQFFVTPWTIARQAPLSIKQSRQEYWSVLPFPLPGESSQPRDQTSISHVFRLAGRFFTTGPPEKPQVCSEIPSMACEDRSWDLRLALIQEGCTDSVLCEHRAAPSAPAQGLLPTGSTLQTHVE